MSKKMLIDAAHPEETRLAVLNNQRIETYESETERQIRNNIYLGKVTRVEASLQAAFVDYGGNKQGFLTFSDIHPDYFQIPQSDKEALLARPPADEGGEFFEEMPEVGDGMFYPSLESPATETDANAQEKKTERQDDSRSRARLLRDNYKIQEVLKPHVKPLLVQVIKEERGGKGAALTTYISLAGRYCVLMPTTEGAGGVSRKVAQSERGHLRDILSRLEVPEKMSLIARTAGAKRNYDEIARDFEYLMRLWENIRQRTLESTAPALIYEEGNLVRRALRDLYDQSIGQIWVEGQQAFREAHAFKELLMPGQNASIREHKEAQPLFQAHGIEKQISALLSPKVELKSGGYLVINQTEALVAVDVNSGRATGESDLEDTALKTNLEAAEEIARQLRMRDLGGLIVIDFIDMEVSRHAREVERALKEHLRKDGARIQMGRISGLGLFEMSRQRLRPDLAAGRTRPCPHCEGSGRILSDAQAGLRAMRAIESEAARVGRGSRKDLLVHVDQRSALYILNFKPRWLEEAERRYGIRIRLAIGAERDSSETPSFSTMGQERAHPPRQQQAAVRIETAYAEMDKTEETPRQSGSGGGEARQDFSGGGGSGGNARSPRKKRRPNRPRSNRPRGRGQGRSGGEGAPPSHREESGGKSWWNPFK